MKKSKYHLAAEKHMEKAAHHNDMARKSMAKCGTAGEELKMAKKGDYKGNSAKKTKKAN